MSTYVEKNVTLKQVAADVVKAKIRGSRLDAIEKAIVAHALAASDGNIAAAARLLGIERKAMERRVNGYGLRR